MIACRGASVGGSLSPDECRIGRTTTTGRTVTNVGFEQALYARVAYSVPMTTSSRSTDARTRQHKAVLFCPECGYDSPTTDNWLEVTTADDRTLVCPVCGAVVDHRTQPRPPDRAEAG